MRAGAAGGEIVVCGAGAAGSAAALAAARAGASVYLIEERSRPGGTVADSLIHTLGGLYDSAGNLLNDGLASDMARALLAADAAVQPRRLGRTWVLNVCPDLYRTVLARWLAAEPHLTLLCGARVTHLDTRGTRVTGVRVVQGGHERHLQPSAVIDATGTAEVVRLLDPALVDTDAAPLAAGGLVIRLRDVVPGTVAFPRRASVVQALRNAASVGALPADCARAWLDSGVRDDEAYLKLFVPLSEDWRAREEEVTASARRDGEAVVGFLRQLPGFTQARIERVGLLGVREAGRIRGEYQLTGDDVRQGRKFPDAACRCAWPIEFWDRAAGVMVEYLPEGISYEVPLRALKVRGMSNLFGVGKCLSADAHAQASARIAGCCWAMGAAAGSAAARG